MGVYAYKTGISVGFLKHKKTYYVVETSPVLRQSLIYLSIFHSPNYIHRSLTTKYRPLAMALCQWMQNKSRMQTKVCIGYKALQVNAYCWNNLYLINCCFLYSPMAYIALCLATVGCKNVSFSQGADPPKAGMAQWWTCRAAREPHLAHSRSSCNGSWFCICWPSMNLQRSHIMAYIQ